MVGWVASEAAKVLLTAIIEADDVVNVQAAPPTDQLNVVPAATEQEEIAHVAPALGVAASVPLVHWNCAPPVTGCVLSVAPRVLPEAMVPAVNVAEQLWPPTVHVRVVPAAMVHDAGAQVLFTLRVVPVSDHPPHVP